VEEFLQEARLEKPQTSALNDLFRPGCRRGTITGYTPRYQEEPTQALARISKLAISQSGNVKGCIIVGKDTEVDKSGCFSLQGLCYELA